jgi:hypothetical protein
MPISAATNTCTGNVTISNPCAGATANYTINFTLPVTLTPGNDLLSFTFATGTSLAGTNSTDVTVTDDGVLIGSPSSVNITGAHIEFPVPGTALIWANSVISVTINDVVNPAGGDYSLCLDYKLVCCPPFDFCCVAYHINLATAKYNLLVDFGPTYPGIALNFTPPFKACGQNATADFNTTLIGGKWYDQFNLIVNLTDPGCAPPCVNATLFVDVTGFPDGKGTVSLNISGEFHALNSTVHALNWTAPVTLNATGSSALLSLLHFDTPGKGYQICFKLICPGTATGDCYSIPICTPMSPTTIAQTCILVNVYQWKDAAKITLREKWNLISLPLVPLVDPPVATTLASINPEALDKDGVDDIMAIWHYNCLTGKWAVWPTPGAGQESLTELKDGEAYWVRVTYPFSNGLCGNITWWVWGTEKPMPPAAPAQYPVCDGWNMVGFLGLTAMNTSTYLWNWAPADVVTYGWDQNCWNLQGWNLITATETLKPGQGYWMAFNGAGAIYVP